jgi:putative ABC transport system substrate-binding protein
MNKRRKLLVALGASALTAPLASFAQKQGKVWRIGFLWETDHSAVEQYRDAFKAGMRELGYIEGKDYVIEQRAAHADLARLPALAAELLALKVDLFVASTTPSAIAARNTTRELPILMAAVSDPVGSGLAASLRRPGGNVTGPTTGVASELYTKRLDLLRQMLPSMRRVGFLYNPDVAANVLGLRQFESDCSKLQFKSLRAPLRKPEEVAAIFNTLQQDKAQGLIVAAFSASPAWKESIVEQAAKHRLPTIYGQSSYVDLGGLISYSTNFPDLYRRTAAYAVKIFKGAKPGDLPIEQPTKFELVINLKTAKALGVTIPQFLLITADKVIQ